MKIDLFLYHSFINYYSNSNLIYSLNFKIYLNKPHIPTHQINEDDEDQPANAKYRGELLSNLCFSTRFLYVISRVWSLSEEVKIKMSAEQPMLVEFKMPEHGIIQYCIFYNKYF